VSHYRLFPRQATMQISLDVCYRPEFAESGRPSAVDDAFSGAIAHALAQCRINDQRANGLGKIIDVVRLGYQSIGLVFHQLFGAAGIGNDDRHPRSLRFDDDIAKGIGRAGKNKNVGGRVRCG
jgi:hypothetical protein